MRWYVYLVLLLASCIYKIDEGYIGMIYKFGELQKDIYQPGFHFILPIMNRLESVQISVQTDHVKSISCYTNGGVQLQFEKVEVVNKLSENYVYEILKQQGPQYDQIWIYERVRSEINHICSQKSLQNIMIDQFEDFDESLMNALNKDISNQVPGLEILSIRITKPKISDSIMIKFEQIEEKKSVIKVLQQQQSLQIYKAKQAQKNEIVKIQKEIEILQIIINSDYQQIKQKENLNQIINEIQKSKESNEIDGQHIVSLRKLETQISKLSDKYLKYEKFNALLTNAKFIIGNKVPFNILIKQKQ